MNIGKKLYHSTSMPSIKVMAIMIAGVLFLNLYFQTLSDPAFLNEGKEGFSAIINFHLFYPEEFFLYLITIFLPAIYYGFIRGVSFYENAIIINRGLPFFSLVIPYNSIKKFEIINRKHFMSITNKETEDDYMFTVNDIDRVLAILDQQHISGDLGYKATSDHAAHKKLIFFFVLVGIIVSLLQYSGFVRQLFR
jgi:hypothetical protein